MRTVTKMISLPASLLCAFVSSQSLAAGFALIENNASGQGNAYAGAAAIAEDASTVWFNPAGMMHLQQTQIVAAGHLIIPNSEFSNTGSTGAAALGSPPLSGGNDDGGFNALVANFYYVTDLNADMKFGFGVSTPFGLAIKYDDTWVGRYHAVESDLKTINFNPSIAYRVNKDLSLGAGINLMLVDVTLTSAVDFGSLCLAFFASSTCVSQGAVPQMTDGFADLTGDNFSDLSWGINFGLMYQLSEDTRIGVAYRSQVVVHVDGDADFTVPAAGSFASSSGLFVDTGLRASIKLPDSLSVSVASEMDELTLLADVTWTGWSNFEELRVVYDNPAQPDSVTTENWNNSLRFSVGADYRYSDDITLRGGLAYDETPVPSASLRTPRLPGNSRKWLSLGGTYVINKVFTVDVAYSHLFVSDVAINNTFESSVPTLAATLNGTYQASVDIFSAQLRWNFQ